MTKPLGVDLSHHNPDPDFGTLKRAGVRFVGLKATEGEVRVDPAFKKLRANARKVGFDRLIFYHFLLPGSDPKAQALHFAKAVGKLKPGEIVALDVEEFSHVLGKWEQDDIGFILEVVYHLKTSLGIKAAQIMLYARPRWIRETFGKEASQLAFMPLWAARYNSELGDVSPWKAATVWQYTDKGAVDGATGPTDLNRWLGPELA